MTRTIDIRRTYPHPRAKVWSALTTPELLARWLMPNDFQPVLGHEFTFRTEPGPGFDGVVHCKLLELDEPRLMKFSWKGGPVDTVVTFELSDAGNGTELHVLQTGFRGLQGRLVGMMLKLGSRDIYGKKLPALLDQLDASESLSEVSQDESCMSSSQGVIARILALFRSKDSHGTQR